MKFKVIALCLAVSAAVPALAGFTQVYDRTPFAGQDSIDWAQFGNAFDSVSNGAIGATSQGNLFQITSDADFIRDDQSPASGSPFTGWNGNFNPGDHLLYAPGSYIAMVFQNGVKGLGMQVESFDYANFTAEMDIYDLGLNYVDSISVSGDATTFRADNSDPLLGVVSDQSNIGGVVVYLTSTQPDAGLAVNQVSLTAVPEPATLFALGLGATAMLRRRKK